MRSESGVEKKWGAWHCLSYKFRYSNGSFVFVSYIFDAIITLLHLEKYTFTFINSETERKILRSRSRKIQSQESEPKKMKLWSRESESDKTVRLHTPEFSTEYFLPLLCSQFILRSRKFAGSLCLLTESTGSETPIKAMHRFCCCIRHLPSTLIPAINFLIRCKFCRPYLCSGVRELHVYKLCRCVDGGNSDVFS